MENRSTRAGLEARLLQLNKRNAELECAITELTALVEHFKELFKLSQYRRFGVSSEKTVYNADQLSIFGNPEPEKQPALDEPVTETIRYTRRKKIGKRQEDLSKLPLEVIDYDLPAAECGCPQCGGIMREIGIETRDEIKIIPAQVIHVEHRRKVYKCAQCEENSDKTPIVKADAPQPLIKGSVVSASVIAYIMAQKYLMHLPLYRQEQDFKRQGVFINRQNMANWIIMVCIGWLQPIYDNLRKKLLEHAVVHSDDTGVKVLREPGKESQSKSTMWLYRTSGDSPSPVAIYEYQPNQNGEHPQNFLKGWHGFCHTDGFAGYHKIDNVIIVGCWAHVRRKFNDAFKISKAPDSPAKLGLITVTSFLRWNVNLRTCRPKKDLRPGKISLNRLPRHFTHGRGQYMSFPKPPFQAP